MFSFRGRVLCHEETEWHRRSWGCCWLSDRRLPGRRGRGPSPPSHPARLLSARKARGLRFRGTTFEGSNQVLLVTWDSRAVPPRTPVGTASRGDPAAVCHGLPLPGALPVCTGSWRGDAPEHGAERSGGVWGQASDTCGGVPVTASSSPACRGRLRSGISPGGQPFCVKVPLSCHLKVAYDFLEGATSSPLNRFTWPLEHFDAQLFP